MRTLLQNKHFLNAKQEFLTKQAHTGPVDNSIERGHIYVHDGFSSWCSFLMTVRARKMEVLNTRNRQAPASRPSKPQTPNRNATPNSKSASPNRASTKGRGTPSKNVAATGGSSVASSISTSIQIAHGDGVELSQIREKVLELLKKHDQAKANRVDILMEKFKG